MHADEVRLAGRQAGLSAVVRAIDRSLAHRSVNRVELRYSVQAPEPFTAAQAHATIAALLRERGLGNVEVSVRPHDSLIDDATGEHILRFRSAAPEAAAAQERPLMSHRLLPRVMYRVFGLPCDEDASEPTKRHSPTPTGTAATTPPLASPEAVRHLRSAALAAARSYSRSSGQTAAAPGVTRRVVHMARITVRLPELHAALERLVAGDPTGAAAAIEKMLHAEGVACAPGFRVTYAFKPWRAGDGTVQPNEADLQVVLEGRGATTPDAEANANTALPPTKAEASRGTLLPVALRKPALRLRVLGTDAHDFPSPYEVPLHTLPARIDRNLLRDTAFGRAHPELLAVASNSCPLAVTKSAAGVEVTGGTRSIDGNAVPMYYSASDHQPLAAGTVVTSAGLRVLVNSPDGAIDPATGRTLAPLLLEIVCRRSR